MPKSRKRQKKAKPDQHAQFVETARSVGADMTEEDFARALAKMAKQIPEMVDRTIDSAFELKRQAERSREVIERSKRLLKKE